MNNMRTGQAGDQIKFSPAVPTSCRAQSHSNTHRQPLPTIAPLAASRIGVTDTWLQKAEPSRRYSSTSVAMARPSSMAAQMSASTTAGRQEDQAGNPQQPD